MKVFPIVESSKIIARKYVDSLLPSSFLTNISCIAFDKFFFREKEYFSFLFFSFSTNKETNVEKFLFLPMSCKRKLRPWKKSEKFQNKTKRNKTTFTSFEKWPFLCFINSVSCHFIFHNSIKFWLARNEHSLQKSNWFFLFFSEVNKYFIARHSKQGRRIDYKSCAVDL